MPQIAYARFDIIDHGARSSGRAGAFVATADDGSAIYYNPAGLARIEKHLFQEDVLVLFRNSKYESPTGQGERITQTSMLPNTYFTMPTQNDKVVFGIGMFVPFGSFTEWSETGPLRFQATYNELSTMVVNPSLGYKLSENISFGLGLDLYEGQVISRKMINYGKTVPGTTDGFYELISEKAYAYGYNLGLLYDFDEKNRLGISYRSRFSFYFQGDATISNIPAWATGYPLSQTKAKAKYNLPDIFMIGCSHDCTDKLALEADVHWINWSQYREVLIDFENQGAFTSDTLIAKDYHDAIIYKLGAEYAFSKKISLRGGYAYSSEALPAHTFDPSNPSNNRNSFYLGCGFLKDNFRANLALALTFFRTRYVDNAVGNPSTSIDGTYKTFIPQLSAGFGWLW